MLAGCFYPYAPQNTIKTGTQNNETNNSNIINEQIGATATATTTIKHTNHHYYHDDDDENEADLNKNHTEGRKLAPSQATCPRSSSSLSSSVARCNNRISWPSRPQPRPRRLPRPRSSEEPPRPRRSRRDRPPEAAATTEAAFSRPPVSAALAPSQKQNYYPSASILFATATTTRALAYSSALVVFLIIIISINDSNHCYCQQISSTTNHLKATPRSEELAQASSKSIFQPARLNDQNQNQNDPNQRAGRHRQASSPLAVLSSNKRRRRAELVQLESGAHVALPRPLAQVARAAALAAPEARQQQQQDVMPYETFYVTQACEWKSNLFVPKSNDIRFAQQQQQPSSQQPAGWPPPPPQLSQQPDLVQLDQLDDGSRTILSTSQKALVLALPISLGPGFAGYEPACSIRLIVPRNMRILAKLTARRLTFEPEQIVPSQTLPLQANYPYAGAPGSFGGADSSMGPARGSQLWLNVSQNQFSETEQRIIETEGNVLAFRFLLERFANKQVPEIRFQVVLTAFQTFAENSDFNQPTNSIAWPPGGAPNHAHHPAAQPDGAQQNAQLICDSQRLISANLACDGYKNCQDGHDEEPATCLAIRNSQQATGHTVLNGPATATTAITGLSQHDDTAQGRPSESNGGQQRSSWLTQLFNYLTRDSSPLIGFLIGLILLILLLVCCACWCHCLLTLLRHLTSGQTVGPEDDEAGRGSRSSSSRSDSVTRRPLRTATAEHLSRSSRQQRLRRRLAALRMLAGGGGSAKGRRQTGPHTATRNGRAELEESDSLARGQNIENTARLKARSLLAGGEPTADQPLVGPTAQHQQQQQQQQYRIQSILKRPPPAARGEFKGAPLARFEAIPSGQTGLDYDQSMQYQQQQQQPLPQPPKTPSRHTTTGGPQHYQQQQQQPQQQQTPSPRRGALASSMTSAARSSGRFASALAGAGDFRPTPAARATTASAGGPALSTRAGLQAGVRQAQPVAPPPLDSHQLHESRVPSTTYRSHQQPQARIGGGLDGDGRQYDNRQSVVTSRPSVSPRLTDHQAAAGTTTATTPPQQQLQLPPQTPPSASTSDSDRLEFKSKTTKLEQTSTVTGSERVTVYQYSSNLAQFSESYLMKQRQRAPGAAGVGQQPEHAGSPPTSSAHHQEKAISSSSTIATSTTTIRTRAPQPVSGSGAGGDGNNEPQPPELPPKTRQSSLI